MNGLPRPSVPRGPPDTGTRPIPFSLPSFYTVSSTNPTDDGAAAGSSIQAPRSGKSSQVHKVVEPEERELDLERSSTPRGPTAFPPHPLAGLEERSSPEEKGRKAQAMMGPMVWASRLVPPLYLWRDTLEYGDPLRGSSNPTGRDAATETPSDRGSRI